jgi:hypothetical protein
MAIGGTDGGVESNKLHVSTYINVTIESPE